MTGKQKTIIAVLAFVAMVVGTFTYKVFQTSAANIQALIYPSPKTLPAFELIAQDNSSFSQNQLVGKWSFMFFGYTFCPDICPTTLSDLTAIANDLPADVAAKSQFVFVSVDPERDTVERMGGYVSFYHPDFIGVTGAADQIKTLSMSVGAVYMKVPMGDTYQMQHSGRIFIIDPLGRRFGIFAENEQNPTVLDVDTIRNDLIKIVRNH